MSLFEKVLPKFREAKTPGSSALVQAIRSGVEYRVQELLTAGASALLAGDDGVTPLQAVKEELSKAETALAKAHVYVKPGMSISDVEELIRAESSRLSIDMGAGNWRDYAEERDDLSAARSRWCTAAVLLPAIQAALDPARQADLPELIKTGSTLQDDVEDMVKPVPTTAIMGFLEKVLPTFMLPEKPGPSPLVEAIKSGLEYRVRELLGSGADVTAAGPDGVTPLQAVKEEFKKAEKTLTDLRVDVRPEVSAKDVENMVRYRDQVMGGRAQPENWEEFAEDRRILSDAYDMWKLTTALRPKIEAAMSISVPPAGEAKTSALHDLSGRLRGRRDETTQPPGSASSPSL